MHNPLTDRRNLRCSAPEVHLIGEIAIGFGNLEFYLEGGIWLLLAGDDDATRRLAEAITAEMSFDRKVHAFSSLYKLRVPERNDSELEALVAVLFKIQDERNGILHSAWLYLDAHTAPLIMKAQAKAKHGLRRRFHRMTSARLEEVRVRIAEAGDRLARFIAERVQGKDWRPS
jgi:hypothetical protein